MVQPTQPSTSRKPRESPARSPSAYPAHVHQAPLPPPNIRSKSSASLCLCFRFCFSCGHPRRGSASVVAVAFALPHSLGLPPIRPRQPASHRKLRRLSLRQLLRRRDALVRLHRPIRIVRVELRIGAGRELAGAIGILPL